MSIKLIMNLVSVTLPKVIGLTGYKDASKTGTLSALKDGSKFTTFIVVVVVGIIMLLPAELRETILTSINTLATFSDGM